MKTITVKLKIDSHELGYVIAEFLKHSVDKKIWKFN